ncbi:Ig-like domain-containing protein [Tuwongella immobilis]|uniref:Repeat-containing protein n=1 Tax=Tuwongella immobilis TaxID=692036 RepID=A0A6C2YGT2_9BACT|nr:Ig-like domain-containing protein [Tuwongella immobilis]VIP00718.1 Repeat-containing protein OS=Geobacter sulfurreducens (strain ATCC 51573 / DSM 12127 / PCA) GN=GSU1945 PE=4 SV=1 [Tuwongella immobilis]VTR96854.1 Repeat-containing protein OS=Geobacter sulfurreducens (strain ATCC 51573 / DSM 12127 / PCA) GN=GSU1945 PE=4 SV=1 [Tuwongella immobilis]
MNRPTPPRGNRLTVESLETREVLSTTQSFNFEMPTAPALPLDWSTWSSQASQPTGGYVTSTVRATSGVQSLASTGNSTLSARFWQNGLHPSDVVISANVRVDSLIPTELFTRGSNLGSATPTYYGVSVVRGTQLELFSMVNGQRTVLATLKTSNYLSGVWMRISLRTEGPQISVRAQRLDTQQWLTNTGTWATLASDAIRLSDRTISGDGHVGVARPNSYSGTVYLDDLEIRSIGIPDRVENFDSDPLGQVPSDWRSFNSSSTTGNGFRVDGSGTATSGGQTLISTGRSNETSRAWLDASQSPNVEISSALFLDSLLPAQMIVRGQGLDTNAPTYYAATLTRGLNLQIVKVENGAETVIGSLRSVGYFSGRWVRVNMVAEGDQLRVRIQRLDTNQWLNSSGQWQTAETVALQVTDRSIVNGGDVGLGRKAQYAGTLRFDDFVLLGHQADVDDPVVVINTPAPNVTAAGSVTVSASVTDPGGVQRVEFLLNGVVRATMLQGPFSWTFDSRGLPDGTYTLMVRAYDRSGNIGVSTQTLRLDNSSQRPAIPEIPRKYSHIRVAQLAYSATPVGEFEAELYRTSIDLVVASQRFFDTFEAASPDTPKLVYTNLSNLYLNLLTDWLAYADSKGVSREEAFYHVEQATAFFGDSPSSVPVTWLWNAARGSANPASWQSGMTDLLNASRGVNSDAIAFGALNEAVYLGYTDKFNELNLTVQKAAQFGWSGIVEYVSAVDAQGNPTQWKSLFVRDTTGGLTRSGQWRFDPPADWVASSINGSARLFHLRVRTMSGDSSVAPVAGTIFTPDYVQATRVNGQIRGTIPAFDRAADLDGDGFLNDREYAGRAAGKDARFDYQSRVFYPAYGQMRFVVNPSSKAVRDWFVDRHVAEAEQIGELDGFFVDNSNGRLIISGIALRESTASYALDYSGLLGELSQALQPRWLLANTSPAVAETDNVVRQTAATMEEFAIRAENHSWQMFQNTANMVQRRLSLLSPTPYVILDSVASTEANQTNPDTLMATLAYYYLIGDADRTFLMLFGGQNPSTTWKEHWTDAIRYDVGQALDTWSQFASGADPTNSRLEYRIYQRNYQNALVLYKPLSFGSNVTGQLGGNTSTTHQLNGQYRELRSDGTLGPVVSSITLANGRGAVMVRA